MRKKEIIIIILILFSTIILILIPIISNNIKTNYETKEDDGKYINIKIEGEINYFVDRFDETSVTNNFTLELPVGISFGEINKVINVYYTKYSVINISFSQRYFKNTTINIPSSYIKQDGDIIIDDGKININNSSLSELKTLYGIGDARAKLIIDYRENKKIENYEELKSLIGVSDEVIEIIKAASIL